MAETTETVEATEAKSDVQLEGKMAEFVDWIEGITVL